MTTHETKAKDLKIKTPQSKKLTTIEKGLLLTMIKTVKEEYEEKLKSKEIEKMYRQLLELQLAKFNELERKLK